MNTPSIQFSISISSTPKKFFCSSSPTCTGYPTSEVCTLQLAPSTSDKERASRLSVNGFPDSALYIPSPAQSKANLIAGLSSQTPNWPGLKRPYINKPQARYQTHNSSVKVRHSPGPSRLKVRRGIGTTQVPGQRVAPLSWRYGVTQTAVRNTRTCSLLIPFISEV